MKNTILLILLLSLSSLRLYCQKSYYISDTTYNEGVRILNQRGNKNFKLCAVIEKGLIIYYPPDSVFEYGPGDGSIYVAKKIQTPDSVKTVFMKLIEKGKNSLLYHLDDLNKSTYYIETEDRLLYALSDIKKDKRTLLKNQLREITKDCPDIQEAIYHVSYNGLSLKKLVHYYNQCKPKPFPFFKFGIIAGYEMVQLNPRMPESTDPGQLTYNYDGGFSVGLFIDHPIEVSNFSVHAEINFSKHNFSSSKRVDNNDYDYIGSSSTLKLPLLIKYSYPSVKIRPYIAGGGVIAYHLKNDHSIYKTIINDDFIEINKSQIAEFVSDTQIGYAAGIGIDYKLNHKQYLFLEIRYSNLYGSNKNTMDTSEIHFITGINF